MSGLFNIDSPIMQALGKMADVMILSILWLLCCLPLITIGASTTALYYASIKSVLNEGHAVKCFFKSFKENWKQSIVVELFFLVIGYILYIDRQFFWNLEFSGAVILRIIFLVFLFVYACGLSYSFPLLSRFVYTTKNLLKNSFLMSILNLPYTIVILALDLLPVLFLLFKPDWFFRLLPIFLFAGAGTIAYVNSILFLRIFKKYMPEEYPEQENFSE